MQQLTQHGSYSNYGQFSKNNLNFLKGQQCCHLNNIKDIHHSKKHTLNKTKSILCQQARLKPTGRVFYSIQNTVAHLQ